MFVKVNIHRNRFWMLDFHFKLSVFIFVSFLPNNIKAVCDTYHYNSDDCGVTEEIPGDTRTQMPWTVGLFHRSDLSLNYTFHATGTIIGPTTILTVFSGGQEKLPKKIKGKHPGSFQNIEDTIVAVGLKSGNLEDRDEFTQLSEISFIEPYLGAEEPSREYHFVLLHLKNPIEFSTPYVRPICLSYFKLGRKMNETSSTFLHGGFAKKKVKDENETGWEVELKLGPVFTQTGYECVKTYEKYYDKHFPAGMFCSRIPHSIGMQPQTDPSFFSCMLHGSSIIQKIGHQWYLAGITALIRGRKAGICKSDAIYFNTRLSTSLEWIQRSMRCSPFSFSCSDGTCIPLESVCNSVRNCLDNGLDENDILCETNRKCDSMKHHTHQCNLVGGCISKDQVCNGIRDCFEGSDESPTLCNKDMGSRTSRDLSPNVIQYCLPLSESEGVQIEYISMHKNGLANCTFIPISTFALLKCRNFYKSKHLYSHLEQQCNDNGKWSTQTKFECEADCGMPNQKPSIREKFHTELDLPWHGLIFSLDLTSQKLTFICAATLIHKDYIVTAGHCFKTHSSLKPYKVVLAPVSKNFSENLSHDEPEILEIDSVWRPEDYDMNPRELDIALVKLKRTVHFGSQIRPACYLNEDQEESNHISTIPSTGWGKKSIAMAGKHVSNFPEIVDMACIPKDFIQSHNSGFKCVGHKNGIPVRQSDTGGGLITLIRTKFGSRYILRGIMSHEDALNSEPISEFTSLEKFRGWISEILRRESSEP